jgi:hypothetical protein
MAWLTTLELWPEHKNSERKLLRGQRNLAVRGSDLPLSLGLQTAPWPPKFKPVSLPKYNGYGNSTQFLMRYESTVNSARGDDVALAKSFIFLWRPSPQLVLFTTTTLNLQLDWPQDKIHPSFPDIPWSHDKVIRSVQL